MDPYQQMSLLQTMDTSQWDQMDTLKSLYVVSLVAVCGLVIGIFFNRGFWVIAGILAYLGALSTMTITVKSLFVNQKYNFPKFVTSAHFLCCGIFCFGIMLFRSLTGGKTLAVPTMKQATQMILPIAIAFAMSVGANNVALMYSNAAFAEMIGGAAPLCVIAISMVEGKVFDLRLVWPVLAVLAGVCLCAGGELQFTWFGFLLIFGATFLRALKSHLQHKIMDTQEDKLEPIELLAWMSPACLVVMMLWGGFTEGMAPITMLTAGNGMEIFMAMGLTCVNAVVLNVANNFVIRDLGAVGALLAGQLKGILLLLGAAVLLGEVIQVQQVVGYFLTAGGVFFYNRMEKELKDGDKLKAKADMEEGNEKVPLVK